jgi:hypothetical protein
MPQVFGRLCYWHNPRLVHPDDRESLERKHPYGLGTYRGVGDFDIRCIENGYLFVHDGEQIFRIRIEAYRCLPLPKFRIGTRVRSTNGVLRIGQITRIAWHFVRNEAIYYLETTDSLGVRKVLKRRFFEEDLELSGVE